MQGKNWRRNSFFNISGLAKPEQVESLLLLERKSCITRTTRNRWRIKILLHELRRYQIMGEKQTATMQLANR